MLYHERMFGMGKSDKTSSWWEHNEQKFSHTDGNAKWKTRLQNGRVFDLVYN